MERFAPISLAKLVALLVAILAMTATLTAAMGDTKLSRYKESQLSELGAFRPDNRLSVQQIMNDLFMRLWQERRKRQELAKLETSTFPQYPVLGLFDKDGDRKAEEFIYQKTAGDMNSQEFGYFFDLDGNDRVDYLIFYGGSMTKEGAEFDVWWMNYHAVDSNADNRIDQVLYQGSTDINGNGKVEAEIGLWLIDDDFDGALDRAVYLGPDFEQAVAPENGRLDISMNLILRGKTLRVGDPVGALWDRILDDINHGLER